MKVSIKRLRRIIAEEIDRLVEEDYRTSYEDPGTGEEDRYTVENIHMNVDVEEIESSDRYSVSFKVKDCADDSEHGINFSVSEDEVANTSRFNDIFKNVLLGTKNLFKGKSLGGRFMSMIRKGSDEIPDHDVGKIMSEIDKSFIKNTNGGLTFREFIEDSIEKIHRYGP